MLNKDTNIVIGKINTGKTRGLMLKEVERAIENNENLLILDNKEEYYGTYAKRMQETGYNVQVLNLKDAKQSHGFNPLVLPYTIYKNGNIDMAVDLIRIMALEIFKEDSVNTDPYWCNSAADYFVGLVMILFKEGKEDEINLGSIGVMLTQGEEKQDDKLLMRSYLEKLNPLDIVYITAATVAFAPTDTRASILSVMRQKINMFFMRQNLLSVLCSNDIKLTELKDKTAIFIIGNERTNIIANILIHQLITIVELNKMPFTLLLDNFDSLPVLIDFKNLIEDASHNNLKVSVVIRDKDEIENRYGKYNISKFQNVIEVDEKKLDLMEIGTSFKYPQFKAIKPNYFNLIEFMKNNTK